VRDFPATVEPAEQNKGVDIKVPLFGAAVVDPRRSPDAQELLTGHRARKPIRKFRTLEIKVSVMTINIRAKEAKRA
jgi:hypothetical protein